ncbi:54S ribosomal protein L20 mitochondrial [Bienertia sinuspersici]
MWDTANNMVISWTMGSVSSTIAKFILFINSARDIWVQLKRRFLVNNGARKYMLKREAFDTLQNGRPISEYFTDMKAIKEEIDVCGRKKHTAEKCWEVIGYPKWHSKSKGANNGKGREARVLHRGGKAERPQRSKMAASAYGEQGNTNFTLNNTQMEKHEQLFKMMTTPS